MSNTTATDYRALCAELLDEVAARPLILDRELIARARAALARWGHQPAPPAEGEVAELVAALRSQAIDCTCDQLTSGDLRRAADLLEQRHPAPVPVSERLPEPEDCDAEERCWLLAPRWILPPSELTHWLPATALPLPAGEVE